MKSKKVLFGLIVAAFVGGVHFASAQPKANYQNSLIEIGPDNIAGRVRAFVVDETNPDHTTLYAGGVAGGLFKKEDATNWQYVPYITSNQEITLPISCMVQLPDGDLLIGTGEGLVDKHGVNNDRMAPKGHGLYVFHPANGSFTRIASTNPDVHPEWTYINDLAVMKKANDANMYIFAATDQGLYKWTLSKTSPDWTVAPTKLLSGKFQDVITVSADNIAYASAPGKLYRVGNVISSNSTAEDITESNLAFASARRIVLAAGTVHDLNEETGVYTHTTMFYATAIDSTGSLIGVYLTKDQQNWISLTTSTVIPFTSDNPGYLNASLAIDPRNAKHIMVGGANLWEGEGFVENSNYQWTKSSESESELNYGNYMAQVYANPTGLFIHSGIHKIVPNFVVKHDTIKTDESTEIVHDTTWLVYYATDGGVFVSTETGFRSINKGLNTVQFNSIAVSPDGSLVGGAVDNSCPFIQSRNTHDSALASGVWYDTASMSFINHISNVLWFGNGGGVASSMFQQITPFTRRSLFVSSESGSLYYDGKEGATPIASFGRACADYADYSNTQTWTIGAGFLSGLVSGGDAIPRIKLWETTENQIWNDQITFTLDTNSTYIKSNGDVMPLKPDTRIMPGDKVLVPSKPNFEYPFYHTFNSTFTVSDQMQQTVDNPVVSRIIITGRTAKTEASPNGKSTIFLNCTPNYFRNVWSYSESTSISEATQNKLMHWAQLYIADNGHTITDMAFSRDGRYVFAVVTKDKTGESFIFRIWDYINADVNNPKTMKSQLLFVADDPSYTSNPRITHYDTIFNTGHTMFTRPVTSMVVDPREGQDNLIITFGGYGNSEPNMVYVSNATSANPVVTSKNVTNAEFGMNTSEPVYSALIECTTGAVFVGTDKGVFKTESISSPVWNSYGSFYGVPVTSIVQQTHALQRQTYEVRENVDTVKYLFAKTKYPYAIYFGTYGRGIFMDDSYVVDHENEISNPEDYEGIATVDNGDNSLHIYPNPVVDNALIELNVVNAGNAVVKIYDITGKMVYSQKLGYVSEGAHQYSLDCSKFGHGMYLVNINCGSVSATSKLIVR